jgi:hypothetical protein
MTPVRSGDDSMERRIGRLEGDVGIILTRLGVVEGWIPESRKFHNEMSDFKATLLATQQAIREEQLSRHRSNSAKINLLMLLVTVLVCLAAWVTFFRSPSAHSFLDFHSQNDVNQVYADRQDSQLIPDAPPEVQASIKNER